MSLFFMPIAPNITLDEATHTYTDSDGIVYKSVSSVIGKYKNPFDKDAISKSIAIRDGKTQDEVLAEWDAAATYGTNVHRQIEGFFLGQDYGTNMIQPYLRTLTLWKSLGEFNCEVIVKHPTLPIAGTIDAIAKRADTFSLLDWKTNKAIYKKAFGNKKMNGILSHLDDCNYVHYSLQLSIYAIMLGRPVNKMSLVHLPSGDMSKLEIIPTLDLRDEAIAIFDDF